jgi:fluoroquinolone transport system permease protein
MTSGGWGVRARQTLILVQPTIRTIRWAALLGGVAGAHLVLWAAKAELTKGGSVPLVPLRVAAVLLCLGAAFVLDDEAGATVEPAVASLILRRGLRLGLTFPVVGVAWATALATASRLAASGQGTGPIAARSMPVAGLSLEVAALLGVTLAAGAIATRSLGHGKGGVAAGPALLAFLLAILVFGRYWPLYLESPDDPGWTAAHMRWAAILVAGVIVLVTASLDPARRSKILHRRRRPKPHVPAQTAARIPIGGKP